MPRSVATCLFACLSCTSALASTWTELFEGEKLEASWEVDRSRESKGDLKLENGRLVIRAEEGRYHHIERDLQGLDGPGVGAGTGVIDGTDRAPLRVDCSISTSKMRGLPTVLALYWGQRSVIALSPVREGSRHQRAKAYWVTSDGRGGEERGTALGPSGMLGKPAHYRIVVTTRAVAAFASPDGVHYLPVVSLGRGAAQPGQLPDGPPKKIILGWGWFGDDPDEAKPDLDNDGRRHGKDLNSCTFDDLRVTNEEPRTPLGAPPGYEAGDTWDETLESYSIFKPVRQWMVLGPLAVKKGEYGPEKKVDLGATFKLTGDREGTWVPHELPAATGREEGGEGEGPGGPIASITSSLINLKHVLGVKERRAVCFAYARIILDEPRLETFRVSGYRSFNLYVNGRWLGGADSYRRRMIPDLLKATVGLRGGVNHVVVRVEGDHDSMNFTLRHGPADPAGRIRFLRRLIADFAEEGPGLEPADKETDRAVPALFEIARLWEGKGCARHAIDVLGEVLRAEDASIEQMTDAYAERARLFKLLKDHASAAEEMKALEGRLVAQGRGPDKLGGPERMEALLGALSAGLVAGREKWVEKRVGEFERSEQARPDRLRLVHLTLAGTYEDLGKREGRLSHLKRAVRLVDACSEAGGADALHVEYAEALLEPLRKDHAEPDRKPPVARAGKSLSQGSLREALNGYRRAIGIVCSSAALRSSSLRSTSSTNLLQEADSAMRTGDLKHALKVLPALYVRACLAESEAGAKMLAKLPRPKRSQTGRETVESLTAEKMVKGWHVVGPFDNTDWKAYKETIVDPKNVPSNPTGAGHTVRGKSWQVPTGKIYAGGHLDLKALLVKDDSVAFLYREIFAEEPRETKLRIGCDDGLTLWFNGRKIHEDREQRAVAPDGIVIPVTFKKGVNRILARVQQGGGDWGFLLRVGDAPQGAPELAQLLARLRASPKDHSQLAEKFAVLARSLVKENYEGAKAVARAVTKAFPDRPDVQVDMAMHFASLGLVRITGSRGFRQLKDPRGAEEFAAIGRMLTRRRAVHDRVGRLTEFRSRGAEARRSLGDFEGAASLLRSVVKSTSCVSLGSRGPPAHRVMRALVELGDLYRTCGYLDAAKRYYLRAVARPLADMDRLAAAYEKLGKMRRVQASRPLIDTSFDAAGMLRTADRAAARPDPTHANIKRAVQGYQLAVARCRRRSGNRLFRLSPAKLVGVAEYAADRIRSLGAEGLAAYREEFDPRAESLYRQALAEEKREGRRSRRRAELLFARVAEEYRYSSLGDDALNRLGNLYLDSGHAGRAAACFGRILGDVMRHRAPATDLDLALLQAKYAFALEAESGAAGEPSWLRPRARRALARLARSPASSTLTVAGRKWQAPTYAADRLRGLRASDKDRDRHRDGRRDKRSGEHEWPTIGGSTRRAGHGAASPLLGVTGDLTEGVTRAVARYEVRFPLSGVDRLARRRSRGWAYHPVATHGAVAAGRGQRRGPDFAGDMIFFHTLDECFAVDLGTGELRWRSGLWFERLRRGGPGSGMGPAAAGPNRGGVPETTTSVYNDMVYVRALRRSGRGGGSAFVVEARDSRDGRLVWSTATISGLEGLTAVSSPAPAGGAVFAVLQERGESQWLHVAAFDARHGELLWRTRLMAGFAGLSFTDQQNVYLGDHMAAPSVAGGDVYVATDMGALVALSAATGSIRWTLEYPRASLDPTESGRVKAMLLSRAPPRVVVGHASLYVAPRDTMALFCIRRANGDVLWRRDLIDCQSPVGLVVSESAAGTPLGAPPDEADSGRLVIQGRGVTSLDAATGAVEWRWRPRRQPDQGAAYIGPWGLAALGGDTVYVPTGEGIHRLRLEDGREAGFTSWKEMGVRAPVGNLIVLEGALVGFGRGRLVRVDAARRGQRRGPDFAASSGQRRGPEPTPPKRPLRLRRPDRAARDVTRDTKDSGDPRSVTYWTIADLTETAQRDVPIETAGLAHAEFVPPIRARWHIGGGAGRVLQVDGTGAGELYLQVGESVARVDLGKDRIVWRIPAMPDVKRIELAGDVVMLIYGDVDRRGGFVSVLDRNTGGELWTLPGSHTVLACAEAVVVRGVQELRVLAPRDGKLISRLRTGRGVIGVVLRDRLAERGETVRRDIWSARSQLASPGELRGTSGVQVFVAFAEGGKLWAKAFDAGTGTELWRHDFDLGSSYHTKWVGSRGDSMYIYSKKCLVRFDCAKRREIWRLSLEPKGGLYFRFEGGYLVACDHRSWNERRTLVIKPETGTVLFQKDHTRDQRFRFASGLAVLSGLSRTGKTVCLQLPGGETLWTLEPIERGGERGDRFYDGCFCAPNSPDEASWFRGLRRPVNRLASSGETGGAASLNPAYWAQPYARAGRLRVRLIEMETGTVEDDFDCPGSLPSSLNNRDPRFVFRAIGLPGPSGKSGLLIHGTDEGVFALGGLPPASVSVGYGRKNPVTEAVRRVRGKLRATEHTEATEGSDPVASVASVAGASAFLARYAPEGYRVFRLARSSGPDRQAPSILIDGRADDWLAADIKAIEIAGPTGSRLEPGGRDLPQRSQRTEPSESSVPPPRRAEPSGPLRPGGLVDLAAKVRLAWDRRYVYVSVEVTDDRIVAPAPGADLSTGDSVIIGFDPEADSAEGPDADDVVLQMALPDSTTGRSRLVQLWGRDIYVPQGHGPEDDKGGGRPQVHVTRTAFDTEGGRGGLFYELAIPWAALRTDANNRPGKRAAMRFGVAVIDWDAAAPVVTPDGTPPTRGTRRVGSAGRDGTVNRLASSARRGPRRSPHHVEWGYGLVRGLRPRLFGDISFVDFSPERVAQYRRFIDILPSHTMSWRFLGRLAEAGAGSASLGVHGNEAATAVYEDFVRHRPRSRLTPWALAELVAHYRRLYRAASGPSDVARHRGRRLDKASAREDIEKKVAALAREAGVPARAIGDALGPGEHSGGLGGAVRQWVYLDPEETPAEIMLAFETERSGWRRCFWGPDIIRWGTPRTEERWPMGELPPAGRWVQLTCPVAALKLEGQTVKQMIFAVQGGRATWDLTEYVADGDSRVLLDDELPKGARFSGGGKGKWVESPVKSGRRAHTNGDSRRAGTRDYRTIVRFKVDPAVGQTKEPTKEDLHRYVEAARVLPDTEEALTLLRRAEALFHHLKDSDLKHPKRAEAVVDMYAAFLRASPRTPLAHRILAHCRRTFERASVKDAVARCETIMNEIKLSRTQRRLFYGEYAAGIPRWQTLGYFDGGAPRAGRARSLPPERFPVNLNVTYRRGDGRRLAWREIAARGGVVDFRAQGAGLAALKEGTKWPVAYLYTRLASPRRQKVSLTVKVRGKCLAWVNGKRAGPVCLGREYRGSEFSIPVSLKKGVNDILLKVSERDGAARLVCRVADLNGRPLEGGAPGGLESRLPPRLLGVLAYERADETRLVFSRPVDPVSAGRVSNYRIDGGVQVRSARVDADGRTVVLTTSELSPEATYTITVTNVADTGEPPDYVEPGTRMAFSRKVKGTGVGLKGEYFDEQDLTKLKLTRIDATVNFDWDEGSPDPAVPSEGFSVRWTGRLEPLASGPYAFHTVTDDGVRLWVDGKKLIDNWTLHAATEDTGEMELQAGRLYSIKMEFFEGAGNAVAKLLWTDPIRGKEVIPTSQLYP